MKTDDTRKIAPCQREEDLARKALDVWQQKCRENEQAQKTLVQSVVEGNHYTIFMQLAEKADQTEKAEDDAKKVMNAHKQAWLQCLQNSE
ncbi:MAG: hypothetical protein MJE68_03080 [Proteobacteria bacterium]|nr:hypothetical protein [Pseudomonadota bacterium]